MTGATPVPAPANRYLRAVELREAAAQRLAGEWALDGWLRVVELVDSWLAHERIQADSAAVLRLAAMVEKLVQTKPTP